MKNLFVGKIAVMLVLALVLFGCSSNGPSESQIQKDVTASVCVIKDGKSLLSPIFDMISCVKTNGKRAGDTGYEVEVEYVLKFKQDMVQVTADMLTLAGTGDPLFISLLQAIKFNFGEFHAGQVKKYTKWYVYSKTEKGWKLDGEKPL